LNNYNGVDTRTVKPSGMEWHGMAVLQISTKEEGKIGPGLNVFN
jgi:hypothetical protein